MIEFSLLISYNKKQYHIQKVKYNYSYDFVLFQGTVDGGKWYEDVHQSLIQEWLEFVTGEFMKMECIGKNAIVQVTVVILEHQLGITIIECV